MQAERTPLTDAEVALWLGRAKACLTEAISEIDAETDALSSVSAADQALRIAYSEAAPESMDGFPFPNEEPPELPCICPPDMLERGAYKGGCPRHGLAR